MRLILIRHGQTPSNIHGLLDTDAPGPGLTELGVAQAEAVPEALARQAVDGIFVSTLVRTHLTAAPLVRARGVEPVELDGFREVQAGDLEGTNTAQNQRTYIGTAFAWARGDRELAMPGGPTGVQFFARYDDAAARAAHAVGPEGTAAVFSHGAAIRCWASARIRGLDVAQMENTPLANTGYVIAEGDPDSGWDLVEFHNAPAGGEALAVATPAGDPTGAQG
ncbi:histidine phosphatase family protein [Rothia kristinae]|uniref:histidine phosphatase family protein n=1 Tax=Rothia kristinae TaxID=37923 RepID=UPI0021A57C21|nr:histidine phosphatase family protein [Rothia kristinae]MCT1357556.1 histidine phosphatase family protein [Rothia kristinae]MCT1393183.1 histidine phosphatase family protein [Rothia kristinae]MCT1505126.1 histidine phosphatase family protein [Rothia kristinae]MCT2037770.1 histidine phosphatase family protein [Rothia kristinae]MCT2243313.1 histidine phosphatase family protein [Rothia kristinae]